MFITYLLKKYIQEKKHYISKICVFILKNIKNFIHLLK